MELGPRACAAPMSNVSNGAVAGTAFGGSASGSAVLTSAWSAASVDSKVASGAALAAPSAAGAPSAGEALLASAAMVWLWRTTFSAT